MAIGTWRLAVPSYKTGYAQSAAQSAYPNLWNGLMSAWGIGLGNTGLTVPSVGKYNLPGVLTNMAPATDWVQTSKGLALNFTPTTEHLLCPVLNASGILPCTMLVYHRRDNTNGHYGAHIMSRGTDAHALGSYASTGNLATQWNSVAYDSGIDIPFTEWGLYATVITASGVVMHRFNESSGHVSATDATSITAGTFDAEVNIAHDIGMSNRYCPGDYIFGGIWSRALETSELRQLYENPLALFRLKPRFAMAPAAPAQGTITPAFITISNEYETFF